ncbi:MAG: hypothetical protein AAF648_04310 [Pseudomonadota bacterium]
MHQHHYGFRRSMPLAVLLLGVVCFASTAQAGPREQAKRLHDRLTGVPASATTLDSMAAMIAGGDALGAALSATEHPSFLNTTVREYATPWSNEDRSVYVELNDTTATVIGAVRDDLSFDQVLYEDIVYVGSDAVSNTPYAQENNDHYRELAEDGVDLSDPAVLVQTTQSSLPGTELGPDQTSGLLTTRGYAESFLVAGTNRAAVRFATLNFLCLDMEDMRDVTAWPDRVRQDVSRSPGGDSAIYLNDCLPCHAGLDALSGAFAYYDFDEEETRLTYTPGVVQPKYLRDAGVFRFGFETLGDSWINYWRTGPNAHVGWQGPGSGTGAKSFGLEISQTRRFAECQVEQVMEKVCHRKPNGSADLMAVQAIADDFEANNKNLRRVFAASAVHCMGD